MAQKKKTIADYQDAFKRLSREMESELGAKASEVRSYAREVYPDNNNTAYIAAIESKRSSVWMYAIYCSLRKRHDDILIIDNKKQK